MTRLKRIAQTALLTSALTLGTHAATANENVMVVFDGSNSMWGQIDGKAKIEIARDVMDNLLGEWTNDRDVGLMAYGHRRRGDCTDIETLVEPGAAARDDILARINAITPTGKTPLTDAVEQAATALSYTDKPAVVVLISDGLESCERDPCALAEALEKAGVDFTAHVVGFGLGGDADTTSLSCIAEKTGGEFISASNADELGAALSAVGTAVAETPEPEPIVEPELPEVTLSGPATAVIGSKFKVTWAPYLQNDYLAIVPMGADEETFGNYVATLDKSEADLRAPADAGLYELRYIDRATRTTLGRAAIEITEPEVTVSAPAHVVTGESFPVSWTGAISQSDYITIVPVGADEGEFGNYTTLGNHSERKLTAPADPGLYEVRYILREGSKTLARTPVEVGEPEVTVSAPASVQTGARFKVSWTGTIAKGDYVAIVPVGSEEGTFGNYQTVQDRTERELKAPADPGLYEVRYILREGSKTLASTSVEVIEPQVTLTAPDSARTGEEFTVSWTNAVDRGDYVAIVPAGSDEGEFGNYTTVGDKTERELRAPSDPGLYEVRYILREGSKTLTRTMIEVVEATVTVSAPQSVSAGAEVRVSWTGTVSSGDYINIVPMGAEEGTYGAYATVGDKTERDLQMPGDPGLYELRYVLREGGKTLASQPIEAVLPEVTLDAPDQIRLGDPLRVSWTGTVNSRDYVNLVPMGTDDATLDNYVSVQKKTQRDLRTPDTPGMYELRYVLNSNGRVLARRPVEVLPADAALNTGASLGAPTTAAPGVTIDISWSADTDSTDQRITLAKADQAIFTWIEAVKIAGATPVQITLPDEPGVYELRFLDVSNQAVLARQVIKVE